MKIHKIKRRKNWFRILIKWFFIGFLPWFLYLSISDYRENVFFLFSYENRSISVLFSFLPYFLYRGL